MNIEKNTKFIRIKEAKLKNIGGEKAIYLGSTKSIHVLNPDAYFIWECLADRVNFDELLFMLKEVFSSSEADLKEKLKKILEEFVENGLVNSLNN